MRDQFVMGEPRPELRINPWRELRVEQAESVHDECRTRADELRSVCRGRSAVDRRVGLQVAVGRHACERLRIPEKTAGRHTRVNVHVRTVAPHKKRVSRSGYRADLFGCKLAIDVQHNIRPMRLLSLHVRYCQAYVTRAEANEGNQ